MAIKEAACELKLKREPEAPVEVPAITPMVGEINHTMAELYASHRATSTDIHEHLATLKLYGDKVKTITEFGVKGGASTCAWLTTKPERLTCYDIRTDCLPEPVRTVYEAYAAEHMVDFRLIWADDLKVEIEVTDLLFIDTEHTYAQLRAELERHEQRVAKFIIMHDTVFSQGCWRAVMVFLLTNPQWKMREHFDYNNGLTVLERDNV